jgi:hypothetical protein
MIHNHCLRITHHDSQPLAQHNTPQCTTTGSNQWMWMIDCHAVPKVVNHGDLCWASGCESWCVILSQWLWIMVWYARPSSCESWCIMLSKVVMNHDVVCWAQSLGIMMYYAEAMVVYNGVLCWASGCESWFVILSQWLWIMVWYSEPSSGCKS